MRYKKAMMGLAALLIFVFHFYVPFTRSPAELCFAKTAYVGVDMFLFLSALSLGRKERIEFLPFMKNRLAGVYLPFLTISVICAVYKKWGAAKLLTVLIGVDFLKKGGGGFLWFAPAILLLYLITPLLVSAKRRAGRWFLPAALVGWAVLAAFIQFVLAQPQLFILVNRLPVFLLGLCWEQLTAPVPARARNVCAVVLFAAGIALLYRFGFRARLDTPFKDTYFILGIPIVLAVYRAFVFLCEEKGLRLAPLAFLGGFTLEYYGLQMTFGYDIMAYAAGLTGNYQLAFLLNGAALLVLAFVFRKLLDLCRALPASARKKPSKGE